MRFSAVLAVGLTIVAACPSVAQEDMVIDRSKVYVTDPAACLALEKDGAEALMQSDVVALSFSAGMQATEFQCHFYEVKSRPMTPLLFVDAVCELPGELYPDTLAIAPDGTNTIRVASSNDAMMTLTGMYAQPESAPFPGVTIFHRCDNLSEISVD